MENFRKPGALLVTVPSLQESLETLQVNTHTHSHTFPLFFLVFTTVLGSLICCIIFDLNLARTMVPVFHPVGGAAARLGRGASSKL